MALVELLIHATNVNQDALALCCVGEHVNVWTKPEVDVILFYARRTCGGDGEILRLPKQQIPVFTTHWDKASTEIAVVDRVERKVDIICRFHASEAELAADQLT